MVFRMRILPGVGWIGGPLLGLASFCNLLWCLGLPSSSRVLLNPLLKDRYGEPERGGVNGSR
jgi:hypothetical protein